MVTIANQWSEWSEKEHIPKVHAGKSYVKKQIFASFPMFIMCSHSWNLKYSSTVQSDLELASACQEVKEEGSKMPLDFKHIQHMYVYMYILCIDTAYPFFFLKTILFQGNPFEPMLN